MSLLTLIADAAILVGIEEPSAVMASSTDEVKQLRVLAQQEGDELARSFYWRNLKASTTFTGTGAVQYFDLPDDWDAQIAGDALWQDDMPHTPLYGPVSDEVMLSLQASSSAPPRPVWRYWNSDRIEIYPTLALGVVVNLEYRSTEWISNAAGSDTYARWVADTDVARIPERVMTLGVVWRWKRAKGLDYAQEFQTYQVERMKATRADGGFRTLAMSTTFGRDVLDGRKNLYSVTA